MQSERRRKKLPGRSGWRVGPAWRSQGAASAIQERLPGAEAAALGELPLADAAVVLVALAADLKRPRRRWSRPWWSRQDGQRLGVAVHVPRAAVRAFPLCIWQPKVGGDSRPESGAACAAAAGLAVPSGSALSQGCYWCV